MTILEAIDNYEDSLVLVSLRHSRILAELAETSNKIEAAVVFYWEYPKMFTVAQICDAIGMDKADFLPFAKKQKEWYVDEVCYDCNQETQRLASSRSDRGGRNVCESCSKKRVEERETHSSNYLASQQAAIKKLKAMPYAVYLETEHWENLRMTKLKRARFRCELCFAKTTLHVHHKTYERRGEEDFNDLIVLCEGCHAKFHDIKN